MTHSFAHYEKSVLQQFLLNILALVQETKTRFPSCEREATVEAIKADRLLKAVELSASFLNRNIFPLLSEGRSLTSFDILGLLWTTPTLSNRLKELLTIPDAKQLFLKVLGRYLTEKQFRQSLASSSFDNASLPDQKDMEKQVNALIEELRQQKDALFSFDRTLSPENRTQIFNESLCDITHVLQLDRKELKHTQLIPLKKMLSQRIFEALIWKNVTLNATYK